MQLYFSYIVILSVSVITVDSRVCKSVDVRNTPRNIPEFSDCRIIEGNLTIVLMERIGDFDFFNRSFTELYEITGYLLMFKVVNLVSLDLIFPKLAYIRGNSLFCGFAVVLHDLPDLQEIGLKNLQNINNGDIRIEKCPQLCYVDTVNWKAIGVKNLTYTKPEVCGSERCPIECKGYCWRNCECQKFVRTRCHSLCVDCTRNDSPDHCVTCKFFNNSGTCVQSCPESKIIDDYSSNCMDLKECVSKGGSWAVHENKCIKQCPSFYEKNSTGYCAFTGVQRCNGTKISGYSDLRQLTNCTHIEGSLEIALVYYVAQGALESALENVVTISEYLKIARSTSITSLNFFRKLKTIKGEKLWSRYYALFVVQNFNLQELFDDPRISVENGEALFQDNPYLCPSEIGKLTNMRTNYSGNNAYETSCNTTKLNVTFTEVNPTNLTLTLIPPNVNESVIGYVIFYSGDDDDRALIQTKDGSLCYGEFVYASEWNSLFVSSSTVQLQNLVPSTRYVYYISIIFTHQKVIKTPLGYFETTVGDPLEPENVDVTPRSDSTVELRWKYPKFTYGRLSYYKLAVYLESDFLPTIQQRNYCLRPHVQCTCKVQEEIRIFVKNDSCVGNSHFCKDKTAYDVYSGEGPKKIIHVNESNTNVQEFDVEITDKFNGSSVLVTSLKHFTMYTFYLRACNEKRGHETDHCGSPAMLSQRTLKRQDADAVSNVKITAYRKQAVVTWEGPQVPNSVVVAYYIEFKRKTAKKSKSRIKCITSQQYINWNFQMNLSLSVGQYALRVSAVSLAGPGVWSEWEYFEITASHSKWAYSLLAVLGAVVSVVLIFILWRNFRLKYRKDFSYTVYYNAAYDGKISDDDDDNDDNNDWKVDEESVQIIKELGQASVGVIYRNLK